MNQKPVSPPPVTKPRKKAIDDHAPWLPSPYMPEDAGAIRAVAEGRAEPHQQQRAMQFIIRVLCATYDFPYRPGPDDRDTNLALGRMYVGQQIVKLVNLPPTKMRDANG